MLADDQLRLETNPFVGGAGGARAGRPLQWAFDEVIRQIGLEAPVVVVSGAAGTGKTLLMNMTARAGTDMGLWVRQIDRGDLIPATFNRRADVLLIDEADSMAESTLQRLVSARRKTAAATIVFLCLPANVHRFASSGRRTVTVELPALTESDARLFLLERAASAGRPELFAPEALDLLIDGSGGSPRMLRSIAGLAFFNAAFHHAPQIGPKHVVDALASQIPGGARLDNALAPSPRSEIDVAAPIETPVPDSASTISVSAPQPETDVAQVTALPDLPAQSVVSESTAVPDPPRWHPFAVQLVRQFADPDASPWLPRLIGAAALAASIAIAAAIPLLVNSMAGSASASKSRPPAPLVIPREVGFASVIVVSPAVFPNHADAAATAKQTAELPNPAPTDARDAADEATKEAAYMLNAIAARDQAAKDAAYQMNARAAADAAAQTASVQQSDAAPQEIGAPEPAEAAQEAVVQVPTPEEAEAATQREAVKQ